MKKINSFYLLAALLMSGVASAQESDDLYFSVKDREVEMVAKREANAKLNAMTVRETMQDDNMRSKFSNPDYQTNANQSVARMPYFKPDYRRDYSFNSLYASNAQGTSNSRLGFLNNMTMSPLSMGMMFGNMGMMGNPYGMGMMGDPFMMNGFGGNSMMWNDPYMMGNSMAFGNPHMMNGFGNPYMMNSFGGNSMMWNDPYMMNGFGNPYMMNGFGGNSMMWGGSRFGMGSMWGNSFGMGGMYFGRSSLMNPAVYNSVVSSVGRSTIGGADNNSVTRPTGGSDYVNYMKSSTGYGSFANSSVGNSNTYSAVEYKGGTANSYFYGTPSSTDSNGTRSVDYNNGGSYNRNNSNSWNNNSTFGNTNGGNSGFGGNSSGFGSGGGGGSRSSGGRGGRGN